MKIDLFDLECDVQYDYEPEAVGGSHPDGSYEKIRASVEIYSVVCNDVELITLLTPLQLERLEEIILQRYH